MFKKPEAAGKGKKEEDTKVVNTDKIGVFQNFCWDLPESLR